MEYYIMPTQYALLYFFSNQNLPLNQFFTLENTKCMEHICCLFFSVVPQSKSYAYSLSFFVFFTSLSLEIKYFQQTEPTDSVEFYPGHWKSTLLYFSLIRLIRSFSTKNF